MNSVLLGDQILAPQLFSAKLSSWSIKQTCSLNLSLESIIILELYLACCFSCLIPQTSFLVVIYIYDEFKKASLHSFSLKCVIMGL